MTETPIQILYVDDEPGLLEIGRLFLERSGDIIVTTALSAPEAIRLLADHPVDAIVSDYQMPEMDGISFLKHLRSEGDRTPFIIFTGRGREDVVIDALNSGADFYLQKGGNPKAQFAELENKILYAIGRRRAEEAFAMSERRFGLLFEHMNAGFALHEILLDTSGKPNDYRFLAINPAFEKLTGLSADKLIGRTVREVLPDTEEYWISTYGEVALTGAPKQFENYSAVLGRWYDVLAYSPAYGQFAVSIQDVTERKNAEIELRRSYDELHAANEQLAAAEEELRQQLDDLTEAQQSLDVTNKYLESLITNANAPIIVWDRSFRITRFNDAFGRLTGIPPEEAIGEEIWVLFPDDTREASMALIKGAMAGETWDVVEIPILNRTGGIRTVLWNSANIRGSDGETIIATIAQGQDITGRKRAEETLEREKALMDAIFSSIPGMVFLYDSEGHLIRWNANHVLMTGYSPEELSGMHLLDWYRGDAESQAAVREGVRRAITEGFGEAEAKLQKKDGTTIPMYFTACPVTIHGRQFFTGIGIDITGRKRAEETLIQKNKELQAKSEELDQYFRSSLDLLCIADLNGKFIRLNPEWEKVLGYRVSDMEGQSILDFVHPDDIGRTLAAIATLDREETVLNFENRYRCQDGSYRWIEWRSGPQEKRIYAAARDVTERKRAEEALADQLIFQQALIDSIPHPIFIKDSVGRFVGCNRAYERVFGTTRAYMNGRTVLDLEYLPDDERQRFHAEDMQVIRDVTQLSYELPIMYADGKMHMTLYSVDGFRLGDGSSGGLIGMLVDISAHRQMEESLQRVNQKLNLFSGITRHDINNQLTVLKGFLAILETRNEQPEIIVFIQKIDAAAEKISAMINFTNEYEQIGAATPIWQNLRGLVDEATMQSQPGTPVVHNEIPGDREIFADSLILKVIYNLIDNAVRHGGDITRIGFSLHERERKLKVICEDDGQGIIAAWKERIFDQGFGENTGFGLTLSREILGITGMTIRETGVYGKGARFEITVPEGGWRRVRGR